MGRFLLLAAYVGLFLEIRYDHNHVLMHKNIAWTPIVYSAVMIWQARLRWRSGTVGAGR